MSFDAEPIVGAVYTDLDNEIDYEVIAIDDYDGIVELKREANEPERVSLDEWYEMQLEPKENDGEWQGMMDIDDDAGESEPSYNQEYLE